MKVCFAGLQACVFLAAAFAQQQPVPPHIGFAYPAGGRQGTTFEVTLGGQNVAGAYEVYLSGSGVQATVKQYLRPLTPAQANTLREQMQALNAKRAKEGKLDPAEDASATLAGHPRCSAYGLPAPSVEPARPLPKP